MHDVLDVAKYIIEKCNFDNNIISNLKLQKVLYFVQAEFLVCTGYPCFPEEIEAWDFGPVIPKVYEEYKVYGSCYIPASKKTSISSKFTMEEKEMIDGIVEACKKFSAADLVELTFNQSPWEKAYCGAKNTNRIISKESIKEFFDENRNN